MGIKQNPEGPQGFDLCTGIKPEAGQLRENPKGLGYPPDCQENQPALGCAGKLAVCRNPGVAEWWHPLGKGWQGSELGDISPRGDLIPFLVVFMSFFPLCMSKEAAGSSWFLITAYKRGVRCALPAPRCCLKIGRLFQELFFSCKTI